MTHKTAIAMILSISLICFIISGQILLEPVPKNEHERILYNKRLEASAFMNIISGSSIIILLVSNRKILLDYKNKNKRYE